MILFLKAIIKKMITVPGYTKRDGTYVPPHTKQVHIESDHAPKFHEHHIDEGNSNAKTHNKKVLLIQKMHEHGDLAGLQGMKHGVNTYGKKQAKLAKQAAEHLQSGTDVEDDAPPAAPSPKAKHFGEQHEGKVFSSGAADHTMLFKFEDGGWHYKLPNAASWNPVNAKEWKDALNAGTTYPSGEKLEPVAEKAPEPTPAPEPDPAPEPPAAQPKAEDYVIDWEKHKLPDTNTNAKSHNKKIDAIAALHAAGDHEGLLALKHGTNTYGKKQALLAAVAAHHLKEGGKPTGTVPVEGAEAKPVREPDYDDAPEGADGFGAKHPGQVFITENGHKFKFDPDEGGWMKMPATHNTWSPVLFGPSVEYLDQGKAPGGVEMAPLAEHPLDAEEGPKEGDTKEGADGTLVFHNGRWHKQAEGQVGAPKAAASGSGPQMHTFHNTKDGHNKFWAIGYDEKTNAVTKHWGKIGTKGQSKTFQFADQGSALKQYAAWVHEKLVGGYEKQGSPAEPAPAAEPEKPASLEDALNAVPMPEGLTGAKSNALYWLKQQFLAQGPDALKLAKKKVTSPKYYANKKMHLTIPTWGKFTGWVQVSDAGRVTGATAQGQQVVAMWQYAEALKSAYTAHTGGKAPKKKAKAPKLILPADQGSAGVMAAATASKKIDGLSVAIIDKWEQTGPAKGSNPGGTFKDPAGQGWYVKFPASADHAKNELLAAKLYKAAGVDVPQLRLVEKGGKIGIASKMVDGVSKVGAGIKDAEGALDGFVVDAWLANHDAVGTGFDNLLKTKDGKAIRIDVGGSLLYRAQGAPKGDLFGDEVGEIENMRNPKINAYGAQVYGGVTKEHLTNGAAAVLEIPDDVIEHLVAKFGPGDEAAKKGLAAKLIARKADLAKKFPEADALANPPKPNPRELPVDTSKLPKLLNFMDWNGQGKGLSSSEAVNKANQDAVQQIYDCAMKGNFSALKKLKYQVINKQTGEVEKEGDSFADHPSQHVRDFYSTVVDYMEVIANPAAKKAKAWSTEEYSDIDELSDAFGAHFYGTTVGDVPANERLGFWISLGQSEGAEAFKPANPHFITPADKAKGVASNKGIPSHLKKWMQAVKASGAHNQPYRDGKEVDNQGSKTRDVLKAAYDHAMEFEEGTRITKTISFPDAMFNQMMALEPGHVFQNPGSMCTSINSNWSFGSGHTLHIVTAKGAKGLYNIGVGSHDGEGEITTIPGQRFMLLETKKGSPYSEFTLLMLPPDQTYVANIDPKGNN